MELKIQRECLIKGLYLSQSVVEHKSTMPVLSNALMEAKGKSVTFTATDLQVGMITRQPADVVTPGKVLIPVKNLYEIARELQNEIVSLKTQANSWVDLSCGKSKFKIMGAAPNEFPNLPQAEGIEIKFDAPVFTEMLNKVSYAMSNDETRYTLNGVYLEQLSSKSKSAIRLVATDGHRLSYSERPIKEDLKLSKGVIVPKKGVWEIKKMLDGIEGSFSLQLSDKTVSVSTKDAMLICRLVDGQFPPYEQVISKDCNRIVSLDRKQFIQSLKRAMLVANERSKGVKFTISPGNLDISSSNPDIGEAKEELTCVYKGETFEVGFNASYFLDILGILEDEKVVIELKNDTSPCIIRSEFDKGFLSVVMPMRI